MTVDLQVNGYKGVDFSAGDLTPETFRRACLDYLNEGAARFLPTLITSSEDRYERNLGIIREVLDAEHDFDGRVPGLHLEGPFLSPLPGHVGAHNPDWVVPPDVGLFRRLQDWSGARVKLLTIAAGQPGAERVCRIAAADGVVVSLGHQDATYEDLRRLRDAGARCLTHLGNGMPNTVDRHANVFLAGLACRRLIPMIIPDGHHLPDYLVDLVISCRGAEHVIAVSDASPLAGLPPGTYNTLGNPVVLEHDGRLHNPAKGCLVGSSATLAGCRHALAKRGYASSVIDAITITNPAALLGIAEHRG